MKDRLTTLVSALVALLLAWALFNPGTQPIKISLPTSEDRGEDGLKGLRLWLEGAKVPVKSLRQRFDRLPDNSGNLLILSVPATSAHQVEEWAQLAVWLQKGNHALMLAADYHLPPWARQSQGGAWKKAYRHLAKPLGWPILRGSGTKKKGLTEAQAKNDVSRKGLSEKEKTSKTKEKQQGLGKTLTQMGEVVDSFKEQSIEIDQLAQIPLFQGVMALSANSAPIFWPRGEGERKFCGEQGAVPLAAPWDSAVPVLWVLPAGQGSVYLSSLPGLLSNENLGRADNAPFLINLLHQTLGSEGQLIFDDFHFGLTALYDKSRFFKDTRLHFTLLFLFAFWLVYVVGHTNRLAPIKTRPHLPAELDRVKATAGFFAGRLNRATLAKELVRHLLVDIQLARRLAGEEEAWQWLRRQPDLSSAEIDRLQWAWSGKKIPLDQLSTTINDIRKRVL